MTDNELAHYFADYLSKEGFSPNVDDVNDVVFKFEGRTYVIQVDARDPEFFRLIYPNFWSLESEQERQSAAVVAAEVNCGLKVAKVFMTDDDTWASVELFINPIDNFKPVFRRSLGVLQAAANRFREGMAAARGDASQV